MIARAMISLKLSLLKLNIITFENILSNCDWEVGYSENHPDIAYNEF